MSDYTPTTKEVREVWQFDQQEVDMEGWVTVSFDEAGDQFDRWLAKNDAEVAERIAKAIEDLRGAGNAFRDTVLTRAARIAREVGKQ